MVQAVIHVDLEEVEELGVSERGGRGGGRQQDQSVSLLTRGRRRTSPLEIGAKGRQTGWLIPMHAQQSGQVAV